MDLTSAFELIIDFIKRLFNFLDQQVVFSAFGVSVSFLGVIGAFIIISFIISFFWKGAKA